MFRLFEHQILSGAHSHWSDSMSNEAILGYSETEKINLFLMLIKDPEVIIKGINQFILQLNNPEVMNQVIRLINELINHPKINPILRMYLDNFLVTSSLNLVKRVTATETKLELNDYPIEDTEAENTIPKQISLLSDQIKEFMEMKNKQSIIKPIPESIHIGMSKTTARAISLYKDVIEVAIEGKDQIVIGSREIKNYLTNHIQEEYRVGDVSNFRKVKKDVLTTLKKLLPDNVLLDRKKYGRREIRLVYET
jgi:hypothetical protein